jgi:DNA-binding transcriptional LysR family regulator
MPIELRLLRRALALAEHHNFVRAAHRCGNLSFGHDGRSGGSHGWCAAVIRWRRYLAALSKKTLSLQRLLRFALVMGSRLPRAALKPLLAGSFGDHADIEATKSFPSIACDSIPMMKTIIAATDAVSVLPLTTVMAEVRARQLVVLPLVEPWFHSEFGVVRLAHRSLAPIEEKRHPKPHWRAKVRPP